MKISKKMKQQLKRKVLTGVASIAIGLTLVTIGDKAGLFASLNEFIANNRNQNGTENSVSLLSDSIATTRLNNTATTTYIYDVADLIAFRNNVNAGNNYSGKTVYLMNDLDLAATANGSWNPIGNTGATFAGTFDGNYHTISNLYINSSTLANAGLFASLAQGGTIQNLIMKDADIYVSSSVTSASTINAGVITRNYFRNDTKLWSKRWKNKS